MKSYWMLLGWQTLSSLKNCRFGIDETFRALHRNQSTRKDKSLTDSLFSVDSDWLTPVISASISAISFTSELRNALVWAGFSIRRENRYHPKAEMRHTAMNYYHKSKSHCADQPWVKFRKAEAIHLPFSELSFDIFGHPDYWSSWSLHSYFI